MVKTYCLDPDDLPIGWRALCLSLDSDIHDLAKAGKIKHFHVLQLKEKYGEMRLYYDVDCDKDSVDELDPLVDDYTHVSAHTCAFCGAFPTSRVTKGWILPVCDKCAGDATEQVSPFDPKYKVSYLNGNTIERDTSYLAERIARYK